MQPRFSPQRKRHIQHRTPRLYLLLADSVNENPRPGSAVLYMLLEISRQLSRSLPGPHILEPSDRGVNDIILGIVRIRVGKYTDLIAIRQLCLERNGTVTAIDLCIFCAQTYVRMYLESQIQNSRTDRHFLYRSVTQIYVYSLFK